MEACLNKHCYEALLIVPYVCTALCDQRNGEKRQVQPQNWATYISHTLSKHI